MTNNVLKVGTLVRIRSFLSFTAEEIARDRLIFHKSAVALSSGGLYFASKMDRLSGKLCVVSQTVIKQNGIDRYILKGHKWVWPRCALEPLSFADLNSDKSNAEPANLVHSTAAPPLSPYGAAIVCLKQMGASAVLTLGDDNDDLLKMKLSIVVESNGLSKMACLQRALALVQEAIGKAERAIESNQSKDVLSTTNSLFQ